MTISVPSNTLSLALTLALTLLATLTAPSNALTCTSQKLSNPNPYTNCSDLPTLGASLHYNYNPTNSSLSIAFVAAPPKPDGWVAWAINPTGTGMAGAESFIAFKENGTVIVKRYDLASYSNVTQTNKLSFYTWGVSASTSSSCGEYVIYASAKVPSASQDKLHYIWQVGPSVTNGRPDRHEFAPANLNAKGTLILSAASSASSEPTAAPSNAGSTPGTSCTATSAPSPSTGTRLGFHYSADAGAALLLLGFFVAF